VKSEHWYEIEVVKNRSVLEGMAREWDALAEGAGVPTLSHAWILACAEAFHAQDQLFIIALRRGGELVGLAPLVESRRGCVSRLELIGVSFLYEPSGLLYRDGEALTYLARSIMECGFPVVLARIPADSPVVSQFPSGPLASHHGIIMKGGIGYSLMIPISSGWTAYLEKLSSRRRYDIRRARRRAEEAGSVTVRVFCPSEEEIEPGLAEFVRIEATGWKEHHGSSLKRRKNMRLFFQRYATLASRSGAFRFAFLDVAGTPIAAQLSAVYAGRFWVFKIGYDEAWSRCSPGWQLLAETIKYAFEHKLASYEFLGSDESWLHGWVTERRGYRAVWYYPATWRGFHGLASDVMDRIKIRMTRMMTAGRETERVASS